ncbi:transcription termination/antitermination factor NusG [bacterium]|jgi:transcription termination/antitermination protein NusG|nr:transcription termination/antitermination factor NusG [Verrucomicrobiota bacterium]NDD70617.1 transcription termination/antitermination factor NusG [bacterium]
MSNSPADFRWYTIQTLSNNEGKVKRTLDRNIKEEEMGDYIAEILMPVKTVKDFRNGKKRESEMKLYPTYLFVRARLFDQEGALLEGPWNFIKKTDGVTGLIGAMNPTPLRTEEINTIIQQMADSADKVVPKLSFNIGERVKITDGPFKSVSGTIDTIDNDRGRLQVSVDIFGRSAPVELEFWQVERDDRE